MYIYFYVCYCFKYIYLHIKSESFYFIFEYIIPRELVDKNKWVVDPSTFKALLAISGNIRVVVVVVVVVVIVVVVGALVFFS